MPTPLSTATDQAGDHPTAATRTVVIADDDVDLVDVLMQRFSQLGFSVIGVHSALEALNVIHRTRPDLACIDVSMPAGNGLSVCEMIVSDPRLRSIPIIVLTGNSDEQTIRRCHDMMVYYVEKCRDIWSRVEPLVEQLFVEADGIRRPSTTTVGPAAAPPPTAPSSSAGPASRQRSSQFRADNALLDAVFAMLGVDVEHPATDHRDEAAASPRRSDSEPPWVLCIDDDADFSEALKCRLESYGVAVIRAFSGMEGYRLAFTSPASAILLDYSMPNGQGDYVLRRLGENPVTRDIPVIVITGVRDKSLERTMYDLGAKRFLTKPVHFETLRDELAKYIDILAAPVA